MPLALDISGKIRVVCTSAWQ